MANMYDVTDAQEDKMDSQLSDAGSERALLAGLFAYGLESYVEISDFISASSFSNRNNQVIYKCVEKVLVEFV